MSANVNNETSVDPWTEDGDIDITELEKILDHPATDTSRLRIEEKYEGFDDNVGDTWIYPSNLPCRSYQLSIAQNSLFRNTLVVLPTGLGKTFIAAVVMYNIYRWYPRGKVIFMAPTRPLVGQQIGACQRIMPFPVQDTVDITGKVRREKRLEYWRTKRVFFATPQVVQADMNTLDDASEVFPFKDVKLIVIDEAHKARGRYAYTEVAQMLWRKNRNFRVLALSATPGRTMEDVADVVRNLFISHLEVRWDNSIDVVSYVHHRSIKTIVVPMDDEIKRVREQLVQIIDPYLRQLIDAGVLSGSHQHISRNFLLYEQKRFRERSQNERHPEQSAVMSNFSICISLFHSLELLERHGLRVFINNFEDDDEGRQKFVLAMNPSLRDLIVELRKRLGPNPFDISTHNMTNGSLPAIPVDLDFGHPKFQRARECLVEHFEKNGESRAIVFCEYRESVMLIYRLLLQHIPMLKPRCFVGQGGTTGPLRALSQKQQIQIMNDFRSGKSNVLIATSIAEEGIDVGEVDLIVCFDINTSNPTRFIQRIGRTGRQRRGYVIMLVSEGKEQQLLKEVLNNKDQTNKKILNSSVVRRSFYEESPRMVPAEYKPKCLHSYIKPVEQLENPQNEKSENGKQQKAKKPNSKSLKTKQAAMVSSQDLRKFFQKKTTANDIKGNDDDDDDDDGIFECSTSSVAEITQRTAESSMEKVKTLFKDLNMQPLTNSNTQLMMSQDTTPVEKEINPRLNTKEIKRLNRILKSTTDLVPLSVREGSLLDKLKSTKISRTGRLCMLKHSYLQVKELFEQLDILKALEEENDMSVEEVEVRETCQQILALFKDRSELERFLEDAEYESRSAAKAAAAANDDDILECGMSAASYERALEKIFEGLDPQGNSWDSFDYRQEELKKTTAYKRFMSTLEEQSAEKHQEPHSSSMANSVVFEKDKSDETITQFDENTITDSKYCSQWDRLESEAFDEMVLNKPAEKSPEKKLLPQTPPQPTLMDIKAKKIKPTPPTGALAKAFERQKNKEKAKKSLETKLKNESLNNNTPISIEIDSDDDELFNMPSYNESPLMKKVGESRNLASCSKPLPIITVPDDDVQQKPLDSIAPTKNIETSFMLRQQSTPIPNKLANRKPALLDETLQRALEIDLDDFIEPFPEELFAQETASFSGGSLKENTKPSKPPTTSAPSDLFSLLENKPTNTVMTPHFKPKFYQLNTALSPSIARNSPINLSSNPSSPSVIIDSPTNRLNTTSLSAQTHEISPCILSSFTKGVERLTSMKKGSSMNLSNQKLIPPASTSPTYMAKDELDSPSLIIRNSNKDGKLKRKVIDSDTESEGSPRAKTKPNSDSDFEEITASPQLKRRRLPQRPEMRLRRGRLCPFFDQEAEKSGSSGHTSDEDGGDNSENTLANFVCDSVIVDDNDDSAEHRSEEDDDRITGTQMQAVYLQSVKSPCPRRGGFKIPMPRELTNRENIYSQTIPIEQSQYEQDSFVVNEDSDGDETVQTTLCPLERAEQILKERKRQAKKRRFAEIGVVNVAKKRFRKCYQLDDTDTDPT